MALKVPRADDLRFDMPLDINRRAVSLADQHPHLMPPTSAASGAMRVRTVMDGGRRDMEARLGFSGYKTSWPLSMRTSPPS